jgi:hypothetical protein
MLAARFGMYKPPKAINAMNDAMRVIELRWQKDVIERWLSLPVSPDSRTQLEELLYTVDRQLREIEAVLSGEDVLREQREAS